MNLNKKIKVGTFLFANIIFLNISPNPKNKNQEVDFRLHPSIIQEKYKNNSILQKQQDDFNETTNPIFQIIQESNPALNTDPHFPGKVKIGVPNFNTNMFPKVTNPKLSLMEKIFGKIVSSAKYINPFSIVGSYKNRDWEEFGAKIAAALAIFGGLGVLGYKYYTSRKEKAEIDAIIAFINDNAELTNLETIDAKLTNLETIDLDISKLDELLNLTSINLDSSKLDDLLNLISIDNVKKLNRQLKFSEIDSSIKDPKLIKDNIKNNIIANNIGMNTVVGEIFRLYPKLLSSLKESNAKLLSSLKESNAKLLSSLKESNVLTKEESSM